jgi:hypothetical protein
MIGTLPHTNLHFETLLSQFLLVQGTVCWGWVGIDSTIVTQYLTAHVAAHGIRCGHFLWHVFSNAVQLLDIATVVHGTSLYTFLSDASPEPRQAPTHTEPYDTNLGATLTLEQLDRSIEVRDRLLVNHRSQELHDGKVILGEPDPPLLVVLGIGPLSVEEVGQCYEEAGLRKPVHEELSAW